MPAAVARESSLTPLTDFTSPKSSTLAKSWRSPTLPTWMLAGLMSRWTRPTAWASSSDSQI